MTSTPTPTRRLQRSRNRTIGGVAAGMADFAGVDVTIVRLAFVALTLFGGSGPLLYLVAWIIMPDAATVSPPPPGPFAAPAPASASGAADASASAAASGPVDGGAGT
ncbi:MAG: PspC domain-containing protein [Actinomycetota bacterium]